MGEMRLSNNLFKELRRRRVFSTAGIYIVGAWVVIQVADIAFPSWGIPDSAMRYLFYAAGIMGSESGARVSTREKSVVR